MRNNSFIAGEVLCCKILYHDSFVGSATLSLRTTMLPCFRTFQNFLLYQPIYSLYREWAKKH